MNLFAAGEKFGRLTIVGKVVSKSHGTRYRCSCTCGWSVVLRGGALMRANDCGRCVPARSTFKTAD